MKNGQKIESKGNAKGNANKGRKPVRKIVTSGTKEKARIDKVVADDIANGNGVEKPVETVELTPTEKLAELTGKLKAEKDRVAKLKAEIKDAKKAAKKDRYGRFQSLADAMKSEKTYDVDKLAVESNRLFVAKGGADSMAQAKYFAKKVIVFARCFEIVESLETVDGIVENAEKVEPEKVVEPA